MKKILCVIFVIVISCCGGCRSGAVVSNESYECKHLWSEWMIDKEGTCSSQGERHRVCTKCGYVLTEKIYKEHQYVNNKCEMCGKIDPVHVYIKLPSEPLTLMDDYKTVYNISDISTDDYYYISNGAYWKTVIQLKIKKMADKRGDNYSRSCTVGYKVYAKDNQVVASGDIYSKSLCVNEYSVHEESIYGLKLGQEYRLELLSVG